MSNENLSRYEDSKRFQKKYLRKVDDTDKHLHAFTLTMKDEDLEYEWRLIEINSRKTISIVCSFILVLRDVLWTFLLSSVNQTAKITKVCIDLIVFFCLYQVFFSARVKKYKNSIQDDLEEKSKWEMIKFKLQQQRESQRQFVWYQIWWFLWVLHTLGNDFEYKFQTEVKDLPLEESIIQSNVNHFMVGINFSVVAMALCLLDVHWMYMGLQLMLFSIVQAQQVLVRFPRIFVDYILVVFIIQFCVFLFSFKRIKVQKQSFLKSKKIEQLLKEQREIFQHLPDGAVIHRRLMNQESDPEIKVIPDENISIDIRHLNITFQNMFTAYKEKLLLEKKKQKDENSLLSNEEDTEMKAEDPQQNDHTFLRSVYLQKSPYKIIGKVVEQIEDQIFEPLEFIDAIKDFESGQVYTVLTKDTYGNFSELNQNAADFSFADKVQQELNIKKENTDKNRSFLIYIVTQEVLFNEEISTITYFRDITFGVLYEQVKAQQSLETAISGALQQKIRTPLQNIIQTCKNIEESENLKKFESTNGKSFREQIMRTRMLSDLMICQIKDVQDWDEMKNNKFRTISTKFDLPQCISEIRQMMNIKAQVKGLQLEVSIDSQYFPHQVIGDHSRFQRVAINLTTNALNHTQQGKVSISVAYNIENQQLIYKVTDTGIGIKPEDQLDLFKTFKNSGGIGMGLIISKEIVARYNGRINFQSQYMVGSTFSFNFDMEDFLSPAQNNNNPSIQFLKHTTDVETAIQNESKPFGIDIDFDLQESETGAPTVLTSPRKVQVAPNMVNMDSILNVEPQSQPASMVFDKQVANMSAQFGRMMAESNVEDDEDVDKNIYFS